METTFPYRPRLTASLLAIIFFGACGALFVSLAESGQGAIIQGLIHVGPAGARWIFLSLAGVSFVFVASGLAMLWKRFSSNDVVTIGNGWIEVPGGRASRQPVRILLSDIASVSEVDTHGTKILTIYYTGFKVSICNVYLPNKNAYESIKSFLATGLRKIAAP